MTVPRNPTMRRVAFVVLLLLGLTRVAGTWPAFSQIQPFGDPERLEPEEESVQTPAPERSTLSMRLIAAHNRLRKEKKLPAFSTSRKLQAAAEAQARDMAKRGKMSHKGSDGSTIVDRVGLQRYDFRGIGENVAFGQVTIDEVMDGWMRSRGHRKNILGNFAEIGAACAVDEDGQPYWCVTFGLPYVENQARRTLVRHQAVDETPVGTTKVELVDVAQKLVDAHNRLRKEEKLPSLSLSKRLQAAAEVQARDMAERVEMSHEGSDGSSVGDRVKRQQYEYRRVGENVAFGRFTIDRLMAGWMKSEVHRRNILGSFSQVGAACAIGKDGTAYWCVTFGLPRSR